MISRRRNSIRAIINHWQLGNVAAAINSLTMMKDLSVAMDFLSNTFVNVGSVEMLNYETAT